VGINSQIFSQTGSYMGLSFAIPIDIAVNVENQIIKTGHVVRGRIGVSIQDVNAAFAESFGLGRPRGALVTLVEPGGPAEKAGIKPGDIILGVNGQNIDHYGELSLLISNMRPGTDVHISVWRERKAQDMNVKIAVVNDDADKGSAKPAKGPSGSGQAERLGLTVRTLSAEEKQEAQTTGTLVVESVTGPAVGLVQPGDIILGIDGKPVRSMQDLVAASKTAKKTVALLIQHQDQQIFVPLRLP
jgi:serine protease Do